MRIKIYNILAAALLLPLAGCNNSDDWTPGPADNETGVRAYFVTPSTTSYIYDTAAVNVDPVIEVTVARSITDDAVSIPLKLTTDGEGITLLGNAEFAAGQEETTVEINYSGIPEGQQITISLEIPDDQFYTYGVGLPSVTYTVIKSTWVEIASQVKYWYWDYNSDDVYPSTYGKLYQLEGTYQFRMTDFFGSGLDMQFICTTGDETGFFPLDNADYDSAKGTFLEQYNYWYFFDSATQTWPEWTPGGDPNAVGIWYVGVYSYDSTGLYTSITMVDDPSNLYGYLYLSAYITFADNTGDYGYWWATFYLNQNPFEED